MGVYQFASVALTSYRRSDGLNNRNVFSCSSENRKVKIRVSAGLVSFEASFLDLQMATFSLHPHMASLCTSILVSLPPLTRTPVLLGCVHIIKGPLYWPHFNLITSLKLPSPNKDAFWGTGSKGST